MTKEDTPREPADTSKDAVARWNPAWLIATALMAITGLLIAYFAFSMARGLDGEYRVLEVAEAGLIVDTPGGPTLVPKTPARECAPGDFYPRCSGSETYGSKFWKQ
jgi:hypothetical protein